jgi:hypothetical protein
MGFPLKFYNFQTLFLFTLPTEATLMKTANLCVFSYTFMDSSNYSKKTDIRTKIYYFPCGTWQFCLRILSLECIGTSICVLQGTKPWTSRLQEHFIQYSQSSNDLLCLDITWPTRKYIMVAVFDLVKGLPNKIVDFYITLRSSFFKE